MRTQSAKLRVFVALLAGLAASFALATPAAAAETADALPFKLGNNIVQIGCTWNNGCDGGYHNGTYGPAIDFIAPVGTAVYAAGPGTVTGSENGCHPTNSPGCSGSRGNYVEIAHPDGRHSRYLHLSSVTKASGAVGRGDLIGYVGNSGGSPVAHLHYDETIGGNKVDPGPMSAKHGSSTVSYPSDLNASYTSWSNVPQRTQYVWSDGVGGEPAPLGSQTDIFAVTRNDAGSNHTAAHVVNGSNWGQYLMNTATGLPITDQNWSFDWGDLDRDGVLDLWGFNRNPGGAHTVVHVLNGANPNQWLQSGDIWLPATDATWSFKLADFDRDGTPDIYAINRAPGWPHTVVHVVNGTNWGQSLQSAEIGLPGTDANWDFDVADFNRDNIPDIFGINRAPGHPHTVVHVINGANWGEWLQSGDISLPATDSTWSFAVGDWNGDGTPDIFGINRAPGYPHTVVHVINGTNWGQGLQSGDISLPATDSSWDFAIGNK